MGTSWVNHSCEGCFAASREREGRSWPGRGGAGSSFRLYFEPETGDASEKQGLCTPPHSSDLGSIRRGGCSGEAGTSVGSGAQIGSSRNPQGKTMQADARVCSLLRCLLPIQAPNSSTQGPQEHRSSGAPMYQHEAPRGFTLYHFILRDSNSGHVWKEGSII